MDVSVLIVNYNTREMTSECIDSIIEHTHGISYEIILVDNGSTDGSKEFFENDSRVKYVYSNVNLGFGRANNLGFKYSCGKYILLLNSDTLLIDNSIKYMSDFLENHPTASVVGCQLIDRAGNNVTSYSYLYPSIKWELNCLLSERIEKWYMKQGSKRLLTSDHDEVAYISGADMMIRRDVIDRLGLFDERFFMYFEDTELSYRYHLNGCKSYFLPSTRIIHLANASCKASATRERMFLEGRKIYYSLTQPRWKTSIANFIYLSNSILRSIVFCFNKTRFDANRIKVAEFLKIYFR